VIFIIVGDDCILSPIIRINETSTEAFILRVFRQANKTGYIKAISENPHALTMGFSKLDKLMKLLFVTKLFLWPRFHVAVSQSLNENAADVVQISQDLTPLMNDIQVVLLDILDACAQEIQKYQKQSPLSELKALVVTVENCLFQSFDVTTKREV
jgi:DNA excision repair protein ERCC-4